MAMKKVDFVQGSKATGGQMIDAFTEATAS